MARHSIGQERFGFAECERTASWLDALVSLIDWSPVKGGMPRIAAAGM